MKSNYFDTINDATQGDFAEQVKQACGGKMISTDCIPRRAMQ